MRVSEWCKPANTLWFLPRLSQFNAAMDHSSWEVEGGITEMYPIFAAMIVRENRRRNATLTPQTPKYDSTLGLERELASVAKPITMRVKVEMQRKKEEEKVSREVVYCVHRQAAVFSPE